MRIAAIIACLAVFQTFTTAADWLLEIVPDRSDKNGFSIDSQFVVLLTNNTNRDLRVWDQHCSNGYDNFSFKVKRLNGTRFG